MRSAVAVLALVMFLPAASGWVATPLRPHHADLAILAAEGMENHDRAFLLAHADAFRRGALDPDRLVNPYDHTLDPSKHKGGAAEFIASEYADARLALAGNDPETAAYELGELAHVVMDLAQPMHTGGHGAIANSHHTNYENASYDHVTVVDLLDIAATPPLPPEDAAYALAERSGARYAALAAALDAADGDWSPEVARITEASLRDGIATTRVLLHAALSGARDPPPQEAVRGTPATPVVIALALVGALAVAFGARRA